MLDERFAVGILEIDQILADQLGIVAMRQCIADDLACQLSQVNVKATTTEKLGFVGRKEGIAAEAVVLLVGA